jgi:hypothetical protein
LKKTFEHRTVKATKPPVARILKHLPFNAMGGRIPIKAPKTPPKNPAVGQSGQTMANHPYVHI